MSALFSPSLSCTEITAPAEDLDEQRFPFYARPRQRGVLLSPARVVRVGMKAVDSSGARVVVLRLSAEPNGECWVTVRNVDTEHEMDLPLTSIH